MAGAGSGKNTRVAEEAVAEGIVITHSEGAGDPGSYGDVHVAKVPVESADLGVALAAAWQLGRHVLPIVVPMNRMHGGADIYLASADSNRFPHLQQSAPMQPAIPYDPFA